MASSFSGIESDNKYITYWFEPIWKNSININNEEIKMICRSLGDQTTGILGRFFINYHPRNQVEFVWMKIYDERIVLFIKDMDRGGGYKIPYTMDDEWHYRNFIGDHLDTSFVEKVKASMPEPETRILIRHCVKGYYEGWWVAYKKTEVENFISTGYFFKEYKDPEYQYHSNHLYNFL